MGIFNQQTFNHPFAKGIQGAPGVGFHLTTDGDYDMIHYTTLHYPTLPYPTLPYPTLQNLPFFGGE